MRNTKIWKKHCALIPMIGPILALKYRILDLNPPVYHIHKNPGRLENKIDRLKSHPAGCVANYQFPRNFNRSTLRDAQSNR